MRGVASHAEQRIGEHGPERRCQGVEALALVPRQSPACVAREQTRATAPTSVIGACAKLEPLKHAERLPHATKGMQLDACEPERGERQRGQQRSQRVVDLVVLGASRGQPAVCGALHCGAVVPRFALLVQVRQSSTQWLQWRASPGAARLADRVQCLQHQIQALNVLRLQPGERVPERERERRVAHCLPQQLGELLRAAVARVDGEQLRPQRRAARPVLDEPRQEPPRRAALRRARAPHVATKPLEDLTEARLGLLERRQLLDEPFHRGGVVGEREVGTMPVPQPASARFAQELVQRN